jgi:hypothetical protein
MFTDTEIKIKGLKVLVNELGDVMTERFISLILKEPFDYTNWQKQLFIEGDINDLSNKAMDYRKGEKKQKQEND